MKKMSLNLRILIGLIFVVMIGGGAYLFEEQTKVQGSQTGQLIPVVQYEEIIAYVDGGAIGQLGGQEKLLKGEQSKAEEGKASTLDFVLSSAGIVNYHRIEISAIGDSDNSYSLTREEAEEVLLSPNDDKTTALINPADGKVMIKVVGKLYIAE